MPIIVTPLRIDRVQQGLFEVLAEATGVDVLFAYTEPTQQQLDVGYVVLTVGTGFGPFIRKRRRGRTIQPIDSVTITVSAVNVGKRYAVVLNGFSYFRDAVGGDTLTTVRDGLLALLNDINDPNGVTAVANGYEREK